jgi:hypothetical protein
MIADTAILYPEAVSVTKARPRATPISPAIKLNNRNVLVRRSIPRFESPRIVPHTKSARAHKPDIIQAAVTNALATGIFLHAVDINGRLHLNGTSAHMGGSGQMLGLHVFHKPKFDSMSPVASCPLETYVKSSKFLFHYKSGLNQKRSTDHLPFW